MVFGLRDHDCSTPTRKESEISARRNSSGLKQGILTFNQGVRHLILSKMLHEMIVGDLRGVK